MAYNPSQYMSSNYEIRKYNGKYYSFQPTKTKDIGGGEAGFGGVATELVGVNDSNIYQMYGFRPNEVPNAVISPTDYNNNAKYTTDEIKQQIQTIFAEMDPRNETGWQSNLDTIVSNAASKLTTDPSLGSKAITNSWNDYRYSPAMTKPVWVSSNGHLVQMPAAEAKAAMTKDPNLKLYGGGQVAVFNVNGNSYYYDPNSAEAKKNMATIAKSAAVGTPNYDPSEPLKFGGLQTIAPQTWTAEDTASAGIASGISSIQNANNRPEFTSQYQGEVYGKTGQIIDTSNAAADQAAAGFDPAQYTGKMQTWMGDYGIVASADNPNQLYWVDNKNKIAQPFESMDAAVAFMTKNTGQTYTAADIQSATSTVGHDFFSIGGISVQSGTNGLIKADGTNPIATTTPALASTSSTTPGTYGSTPTDARNTSGWSMVNGLLDVFSKAGISADTISKIKNDPTELALMTSAITYGGYAPADIFRELKRYEGLANGDTSLQNVTVIDPNKTSTEFKNSTGYSAMVSDARLKVPQTIADIDSSVLELPVYQLPDDVFTNLQKGYDIQSPEFQAEMEKVKTLLYDAQDQLLSAQSESDHQVAEANYKQLQSEVAQNYGIQLSNNAFDAYNQIDSIGKSATAAGLYGSGIADEVIDKTLAATRKNDQLQRTAQLSSEEKAKASYYQTSASSAEIAALTPEERTKYGLTPSQEAINFYNIDNLRKQYPDTPDNILQQYANSMIDSSSGTPIYRSNLYSTMYTNKMNNNFAKINYQQTNVQDKYTTADELQNRKYDFSDPFNSKPTAYETANTTTMPSSMTNGSTSSTQTSTSASVPYSAAIDQAARDAAAKAAGSISTPSTPAPTPAAQTPAAPASSTGSSTTSGTTKMKNQFGDIIDIPNANVQMSLNSGYTKV